MAKAYSLYSTKTSSSDKPPASVTVEFVLVKNDGMEGLSDADVKTLHDAAYSIQLTSRIVDTPCNMMHTEIFIKVKQKLPLL